MENISAVVEIQNSHCGSAPASGRSDFRSFAGPTCPAGTSHGERRRSRSGCFGVAGRRETAQRLRGLTAALLVVGLVLAAVAAEPRLADRFDPSDKGLAGGWQVVRGQAEPQLLVASKDWVGRASNGYAYAVKPSPDALVLAGDAAWDNYAVTASLKADPGATGGLVVRYADDASLVQVLLSFPSFVPGDTGRLTITQRQAGKEAIVAARRLALHSGEWYRLRVALAGPHLLVWLDDSLALQVRAAKPTPGRVGLYARQAPVLFDDVQVEPAGIVLEDFAAEAAALRPRCGAWERVLDEYPPTQVRTVADDLLIATFRQALPARGEISADVSLGDSHAVGVLVESPEPCGRVAGNGWALQLVETGTGGRVALVRLSRGKSATIQTASPPVDPAGWSTLRLAFEPCFLRAWCGERLLFEQWDEGFRPVRAGILAAGAGAGVDNVLLVPTRAPADPWLAETMVQDLEMKHQWAHPAWTFMATDLFPKAPNAVPLPWNKGAYFRDFDLQVPIKDWATVKGTLVFSLGVGDRNEKNSYRLTLTRAEKSGMLEALFSLQGKTLATGRRAVPGPGVGVQLLRRGRCFSVRADGQPVLRYDGL